MQKAALQAAKLRGLARAAGVDELQPVAFPGGAAALGPAAPSTSGGAQSPFDDVAVPSTQIARPDTATSLWVLAGDLAHLALGPALALSARHGWPSVELLIDDSAAAGLAARRAHYFVPAVRVWSVVGTAIEPASAAQFRQSPLPMPPLNEFAELIVRAGAEAVWEHAVLRAEVRGLEIARVVDVDGVPELQVGVGKHDREAHRMAHEVTDPETALRALVAQISVGRRAGAPAGLATDLGRERWLRWIACRYPEVVGAAQLSPVDPPDERADLRSRSVAPAVGTTSDGEDAVYAFSVGVDTNLVPAAADVAPDRQLVLVVPDGDEDGITSTLAATLRKPALVQTVPLNWPAMGD